MKFLHVTEIRDVVLNQMELLPPVLLASLPNTPPATSATPTQMILPQLPNSMTNLNLTNNSNSQTNILAGNAVGTAVVSLVPQNDSGNLSNPSVTNTNLTNNLNLQSNILAGNGQQQQQQPISAGNSSKFDIEGRYWVKPLFLKVLRKVSGVSPTQVVFSYREVNMNIS